MWNSKAKVMRLAWDGYVDLSTLSSRLGLSTYQVYILGNYRELVADNQTMAGIFLARCPLMHNLHPRSLHV